MKQCVSPYILYACHFTPVPNKNTRLNFFRLIDKHIPVHFSPVLIVRTFFNYKKHNGYFIHGLVLVLKQNILFNTFFGICFLAAFNNLVLTYSWQRE